MTKFESKDDTADISIKNGAEWYHFVEMSLMTLMTSLKEDEPNGAKNGS